jgi:hypothetical protein
VWREEGDRRRKGEVGRGQGKRREKGEERREDGFTVAKIALGRAD